MPTPSSSLNHVAGDRPGGAPDGGAVASGAGPVGNDTPRLMVGMLAETGRARPSPFDKLRAAARRSTPRLTQHILLPGTPEKAGASVSGRPLTFFRFLGGSSGAPAAGGSTT